jgi:hypothetical protein
MDLVAASGTIADKQVLLDFAVEAINKLLYSFLINQDMFDNMGALLNDTYEKIEAIPESVNNMFIQTRKVLAQFEEHVDGWVTKHCTEEEG